jgi:hypothetical protein
MNRGGRYPRVSNLRLLAQNLLAEIGRASTVDPGKTIERVSHGQVLGVERSELRGPTMPDDDVPECLRPFATGHLVEGHKILSFCLRGRSLTVIDSDHCEHQQTSDLQRL